MLGRATLGGTLPLVVRSGCHEGKVERIQEWYQWDISAIWSRMMFM
jgi:hypothetical protein